MDIAPSTQLAQQALLEQVGSQVGRKSLDAQRQIGQDVLDLISSAASAFEDPHVGRHVDALA